MARLPGTSDGITQIVEADSADVRMAEHLAIPIGAPVLLVRRLYISSGERPIAYFESFFRADRYMYTVKLRQLAATPGSSGKAARRTARKP